jgi:hypothetical protein
MMVQSQVKNKIQMKQEQAMRKDSALGIRSVSQAQNMLVAPQQRQMMKIQQKMISRLKSGQLYQQKMVSQQNYAIGQQMNMRQDQRLNFGQRQRFKTRQIEIPKVKFKFKFQQEDGGAKQIFRRPIKMPPQKAFDITIKRKGKWRPLGVALTEKEASKLAQIQLKKSLAASARLVPTKKKLQHSNIQFIPKQGEFRQYQIKGGKKIFDPKLFIQETGSKKKGFSRLGTRSEVFEIQASKKSRGKGIKW